MATTNSTPTDRASPLNDWARPFQWLLMTPVIVIPLGALLFGQLAGNLEPAAVGLSADSCKPPGTPCFGPGKVVYSEVVPTILAFTLPGLVGLVPFLWLLSPLRRARLAGLVAGLLGLLWLFIPLTALMLLGGRVTRWDGTSYFRYIVGGLPEFPVDEPYLTVWVFGALAWFVSLIVWGVFAAVTANREDK